MRMILALCAAALLAGCASMPAKAPAVPSTRYVVTLPDDIYHFRFVVDTAHDTAECDPSVPLRTGQVPAYLEFTYYPCTGLAFSERMRSVAKAAAAARKVWETYRPVPRIDGKDVGRVVVIGTPHPTPYVVYRDAHPGPVSP